MMLTQPANTARSRRRGMTSPAERLLDSAPPPVAFVPLASFVCSLISLIEKT